jgi:glutathione peroxidase
MSNPIFDLSVTSIQGQSVPLNHYQGKVLLIVNTASKCGFTPQYKGLEALYRKYKEQGLEILGFPCNQFGQQEQGNESEISEFCQLNYGVSFPMFAKVDVNGPDASPLFKLLKQQKPGLLGTEAIKWNFTKFLIGRDGKVMLRAAPLTKPEELEAEIQRSLAK